MLHLFSNKLLISKITNIKGKTLNKWNWTNLGATIFYIKHKWTNIILRGKIKAKKKKYIERKQNTPSSITITHSLALFFLPTYNLLCIPP
jgi:hypothetical protein